MLVLDVHVPGTARRPTYVEDLDLEFDFVFQKRFGKCFHIIAHILSGYSTTSGVLKRWHGQRREAKLSIGAMANHLLNEGQANEAACGTHLLSLILG